MTRTGPLVSPLLIGRDDLLDLAERRLSEAAAGRRQFLLLAGDAGIGKSRLMGAIESRARAAGFRTAAGFLSPHDSDVPGASLLDLARSMARARSWSQLGRSLLELVDETIGAPQPRRRLLVLRAVDLVTGAIDGPTLLSFDDLQWADNLSLEILTELARATADRRLLMVGTYRTDELRPGAPLREWRARLLTQRAAEEARLGRLDLEQTALMTTLILGTGLPAPRDVTAAVFERTDGVPLHIEELLGALSESERADSRAIRDAAVPDTLEDAILRRIGRLSPEAQAVARSGAVIGRCFVPDVLARVMDVPSESLDAPVRELLDEHVLMPPGERGLLDFRHQLLRDALYRSLGEADRRRLHARAAEYGRELEGASEIHASVHFERAGMTGEAFRSAVQGARTAASLSSHREAFELYRRAVDNMPATLPMSEQAGVLFAMSVEAAAIEEIDACESAAADARRRFREVGDDVGAAAQLWWLAQMRRRRAAPIAERVAALEAAIVEADALDGGPLPLRIRAALRIELALALTEGRRVGEARVALSAARAQAGEIADEELLLHAASIEGQIDAVEGNVARGLDAMAAVARQARERGFEDVGVTAYRDTAVTAARMIEYRRAAESIEEGLRYADAIEQSHCSLVMAATDALLAWAAGRWDDAVARAEHALADQGSERAAGMARWPLAYVALGRGDRDAATEHLRLAEPFALRSEAPDLVLAWLWGGAELSLVAGDAADAIARTETAFGLAHETGERGRFVPFVVTGTRARLSARRPGDAERWVDDAARLLGEAAMAGAAADHASGLVQLAAGSTGSARVSLEHAVAGWDAKGRTWEALWARLDLATCFMRSSRFADASRLTAEVGGVAERLRSHPLLERVQELNRLLRRKDAEQAAWHPLTAREFEVARLIAGGLTNAEIAAELSVSPRTVGAHVEHVLAKLGASRRTEIASWVAKAAIPASTTDGAGRVAAVRAN